MDTEEAAVRPLPEHASDLSLRSNAAVPAEVLPNRPRLRNVPTRRTSDAGLPASSKTPPTDRLSLSGTAGEAPHRGRGTPQISPRENRSSLLRRSQSGNNSSLKMASSLPKDNGTPNGATYELTRLRDDLRAKQKDSDKLVDEVATLKGCLSAKERALAKASSDNDTLRAQILHAEGELASKAKELRTTEAERNRLRSSVQDLEREADRLSQKLHAKPMGSGFSDSIAALEAEVKSLKAENQRLSTDNKAAENQIRAKDKKLDNMSAEVEEAQRIKVQNGDLENYILDLRRQLQEAADDRATLVGVQRQTKSDLVKTTEDLEEARRTIAQKDRELAAASTQLKASEANASELSRELDLRKDELTRVSRVAGRAVNREIQGGIKDDGVVPFTMYRNEVMHLKGEIERLKEKLRLSEKSAAATLLQKERLHKQLDKMQQGQMSLSGQLAPVKVEG